MNKLQHISEDDLIAFHLHESATGSLDENAIRQHLETCVECAELSASIAETLRVFSAEPVPEPNLEQNWQRLRGNLSVLSPAHKSAWRWLLWPSAGLATAAVALLLIVGLKTKPWAAPHREQATLLRKGPLTDKPTDPQIANHLDSAERLLTEVNHASGPLDEATLSQAHDLLLKNAVYVKTAHEQGDLSEASVLENLGRVLTNIDHESTSEHGSWHLRFAWNTDGLLLEIRILRQNDNRL
ncbi:hypothetical protein [Granulicella arctica]|uniref:hypothetical protein n=1 Tax=Granulicella arctica TaxID=940613 RepID=UPI0021DF9128|nr:hypothetical protein [Granulicella arctica]